MSSFGLGGDVVYLKVVSGGLGGGSWTRQLEKRGFDVFNHAKVMTYSFDISPTSGMVYDVALLKSEIFKRGFTLGDVQAKARRRKFTEPNPEIAYLLAVTFGPKALLAMGFKRIIVMHKPIIDSTDLPFIFYMSFCDDAGISFAEWPADPRINLPRIPGTGFAYIASQACLK